MAHVVVFAGEYDLNNKGNLRKEFRALYSANDVVLDLSNVTYVDSTFLSELIMLIMARVEQGLSRAAVVSRAHSIVRRLLKITGIEALIDVVESYSHEGGLT